jgi:hypothetical protein
LKVAIGSLIILPTFLDFRNPSSSLFRGKGRVAARTSTQAVALGSKNDEPAETTDGV